MLFNTVHLQQQQQQPAAAAAAAAAAASASLVKYFQSAVTRADCTKDEKCKTKKTKKTKNARQKMDKNRQKYSDMALN